MKNIFLLTLALLFLRISESKAQYADIYNFNGANGANPRGSLTASGNKLYGMTESGGAHGFGCVFSIDSNGNGFRDILDFNSSNGANPYGSLIISGKVLYGMTSLGGINNAGCIFSIDTNGARYKDLFDFKDSVRKAYWPHGSLILLVNKLYGMTTYGGFHGTGAIFSIDTNGNNYQVLFNFYTYTGQYPYGALTNIGKTLYGMTLLGGGYGNIFSLDTNGNNFKVLWSFVGIPQDTAGIYPYGSLIISNKVLYGMTGTGGLGFGNGRVFSIDTDGTGFKDLHDFNLTNGTHPNGSLLLSGNLLYGMTSGSGIYYYGNIFSLNISDTTYRDLYEFNGSGGANPYGDLTAIGNTLYGMTSSGGLNDSGVIFHFKDIGLGVKGLNEFKVAATIFPNPNKGQFSIELGNSYQLTANCSVEIYNMLGEMVYSSSFIIHNSPFTIDISGQAPEIYLYRLISESGTQFAEGKFVIER